jgi:hypothetical protein
MSKNQIFKYIFIFIVILVLVLGSIVLTAVPPAIPYSIRSDAASINKNYDSRCDNPDLVAMGHVCPDKK